MKKLLFLIGILFISINVTAQRDSLFTTKKMGNRVALSPKMEENPFIGMKQGIYTPTSDWLIRDINAILKSNFNESQRSLLSNAKILVNVYGDWSGEIKFVDFVVSKNKIDEISFEDLNNLLQLIKKIKVPQSENLSVYKEEADYFKLTCLIKD